eukprot:scaffold25392_cov117-Cylindrotheca_fusiformis.AAC.2
MHVMRHEAAWGNLMTLKAFEDSTTPSHSPILGPLFPPSHQQLPTCSRFLQDPTMNKEEDEILTVVDGSTTASHIPMFGPLLPSQQFPTCWRGPQAPVNKEEEKKAREEMTSLLQQKIILKCRENGKDCEQDVQKAACAMEQHLFKQAKDLSSYQDKSTLDDRLRGLMAILVRKRMIHRAKSAKQDRKQLLVQHLGFVKYRRCTELIRAIRIATATKASRMRCNSQQHCSISRGLGSKLPPVVRALYFETKLVDAFESCSSSEVASVNWDALMERAEANLREFQMWENGHIRLDGSEDKW